MSFQAASVVVAQPRLSFVMHFEPCRADAIHSAKCMRTEHISHRMKKVSVKLG